MKLWVNEWLDGTTRFQMSGAQRAFWIDLLALAGRSRYPGIVCAGMDGDRYVGYPLKTFAALDAGAEIDLVATFDLFARTGKVIVEVTTEAPVKLYMVRICNWIGTNRNTNDRSPIRKLIGGRTGNYQRN